MLLVSVLLMVEPFCKRRDSPVTLGLSAAIQVKVEPGISAVKVSDNVASLQMGELLVLVMVGH